MDINERINFVREKFCNGQNLDFALKLGYTPQFSSNICKSGKNVGEKVLNNILSIFPEINEVWLKLGQGEMLKSEQTQPIINNDRRGVPFYNVDFIGGFDLVENNQTTSPAYYIDFAEYNNADMWINVTGKSMEPTLWHGDKISVKELNDWNTYLLYGEIYAIVTDEYRTVKIIRKSSLGDDYIRLIPINPDFDEQDIPKTIVKRVFTVLGSAKKLF